MESRHDLTVGNELKAATETGQIQAVPGSSDAGDQPTTWRSSVGVVAALVAAFVLVTLVSL
ncbi:hypothetical protein ACT3SQ_17390 [Brachybacterium sp. AOP42-C2-15]|uniref:hypothetical protein n=1 Tax=unclassified Brachybacterium TaxID=2623841 RepID=UPI00402A8687